MKLNKMFLRKIILLFALFSQIFSLGSQEIHKLSVACSDEEESFSCVMDYPFTNIHSSHEVHRSNDFYLSIDKVEPCYQGFMIHFLIGNPMNAHYYNLKGTLSWGNLLKNNIEDVKINIVDELKAGSWNRFVVIFSPQHSIEDINYIFINRITFDSVGLLLWDR